MYLLKCTKIHRFTHSFKNPGAILLGMWYSQTPSAAALHALIYSTLGFLLGTPHVCTLSKVFPSDFETWLRLCFTLGDIC
jgi:hypothetical protein